MSSSQTLGWRSRVQGHEGTLCKEKLLPQFSEYFDIRDEKNPRKYNSNLSEGYGSLVLSYHFWTAKALLDILRSQNGYKV
jgi:hypothetical protein